MIRGKHSMKILINLFIVGSWKECRAETSTDVESEIIQHKEGNLAFQIGLVCLCKPSRFGPKTLWHMKLLTTKHNSNIFDCSLSYFYMAL